jgi:hypothetical protein
MIMLLMHQQELLLQLSKSLQAEGYFVTSRLLTKSASGVLAVLRGSTYGRTYASPLRVLRPCWTAFLNSLWEFLNESVRPTYS